MRLWSKQLIEYLPNKQLIAQWREILAIVGSIKKKGYPNHILVNKVMDYDLKHFSSYSKLVTDEINKRNFVINKEKLNYIYSYCGKPDIDYEDIYLTWHDEEYIKICLYNMYEKHICGGITSNDWKKLMKKFGYLMNY